MVTAEEDVFLQFGVLHLLKIEKNILANGFDSKLFA